ncbi:signal peptidase I [Marmoricola sp. URHA0025 HA25]
MADRGKARRRLVAGLLALSGVLVLLGLRFVAEPMRVSSDSMAPTYRTGTEVLVTKAISGRVTVHRGDVVVLRAPVSGALVVKRVAGTGGDVLAVMDGVLVVNGEPVVEPYVEHARVDGTYFGPVVVPADAVFVLGDNRADSIDSRDYGSVSSRRVVGMVRLRLWD